MTIGKGRFNSSFYSVSIALGYGLSPVRRQTITWINARLLSVGLRGTNSEIWIEILAFSFKKMHLKKIWIEILAFSFKKMHLKMLSGKWRPFCPGGGGVQTQYLSMLCVDISYFLCFCFYICPNLIAVDDKSAITHNHSISIVNHWCYERSFSRFWYELVNLCTLRWI